jgi:transglutaminase-like putative cysteine protease
VMVRTDRAGAEGKRAAPELLVSSFVRPDRPLEAPRALVRAVYRVRDRQGKLAGLPQTAGQRVSREGEAFRVEVSTKPPEAEPLADPAPYLAPSAFLDYESPPMRALAAKALEAASPELPARAEALRRFVRAHMRRYDLRTGFATASQVAEQRSGDCTESAVLLAALLRAGGIPSRVVTGLLFIESFEGQSNVFGYHMWAQAHLDGRWVDLDAITAEPFDAAHIALATSALDQPQGLSTPENLAPLAVSELVIEVLETVRGD